MFDEEQAADATTMQGSMGIREQQPALDSLALKAMKLWTQTRWRAGGSIFGNTTMWPCPIFCLSLIYITFAIH